MRRADRLFDIIQVLRLARGPLTAAAIAAELEVAPRTVYRDIATLQTRQVPIRGAAGLGYVLRRGFELPPMMFTEEEAEAIVVGLRMLGRTGDPGLMAAARGVLTKLEAVVPEGLRLRLSAPSVHVSPRGPAAPEKVDLAVVRGAIRDSRKLRIEYLDLKGTLSRRTVRPIAVEYFVEAILLCGWCELRDDFRHFRVDRIGMAEVLEEGFAAEAARLKAGWLALTRTG